MVDDWQQPPLDLLTRTPVHIRTVFTHARAISTRIANRDPFLVHQVNFSRWCLYF